MEMFSPNTPVITNRCCIAAKNMNVFQNFMLMILLISHLVHHQERRDLREVLRSVVRPLQASGAHLGRPGQGLRRRGGRRRRQGGLHQRRQREQGPLQRSGGEFSNK